MRVLVAGATGVIGRRATDLLLARGHQVTGLSRSDQHAATLRARGADAMVVDVYDAEALADAVKAAAPDVVMHQLTDLSGGSSEANARMRRIGTRNLTDAALTVGVRRIVAQSVAWAYQAGPNPADEGTPLDLHASAPRSTTVGGVVALESSVRDAPEWVVLRYGLLYGPDTWYTPGGLVAEQARRRELMANADVSSFVQVDDAAEAAVAALDWPTGVANICDDEPATGHEWAPLFARWVGAPEPPKDLDTPRPGWARGADNRRARHELGWEPRYRSWRDGFTAAPRARF